MIQPHNAVQLRTAGLCDVPQVAKLHIETWKIAYAELFPTWVFDSLSFDSFASRWRTAVTEEPGQLEVACIDDVIVGFVNFSSARDQSENQLETGEIIALYLHPSYWGEGIGMQLASHAFSILREQGFSSVILWCLAENARARRFYEKRLEMNLDQVRERDNRGVIKEEVCYRKEL